MAPFIVRHQHAAESCPDESEKAKIRYGIREGGLASSLW